MQENYQPQQIEPNVQKYWQQEKIFVVTEDTNKEKFYCLSMLPYPSGNLHMGHVRNYTIGDVITRYQRMLGKNVLQPMGWDAFGLPAENAALENKLSPAKWTYANIDQMRTVLKQLGFAFDWQREFATCTPDYYRWEQWLFLRMYEKGLVYKKKAYVNWDPVDQTVLANEQVIDGRGWRSGAQVERREIEQWFLKITAYADELLNYLDKLIGWPEEVRTMQRNWIGRSEGVEVNFALENNEILNENRFSEVSADRPEQFGISARRQGESLRSVLPVHDLSERRSQQSRKPKCEGYKKIKIFTTRPDTLFGVTYLALAPQHPLALKAAENNPALAAFIKKCQNIKSAEAALATLEKEGVNTGFTALNPLSNEVIPVWVANFVLMEYGSGAVMAVPGHDQRDFEFAQKYHLKITPVIKPKNNADWDFSKEAFTDYGILYDSGIFSDLPSEKAIPKIIDHIEKLKLGARQINFRLRDWGISRQRYWGAPIPMINCPKCGLVAVPEDELPVVLPEDVNLDAPGSPLKNRPDFFNTTCHKCGAKATRETDTFDTFMESSWYYARYSCPNQNKAMLDERADYWLPVDQYIGGIEHAVMHLLYARFMHKVMRDFGLVKSDEPFTNLLTQGMVIKDGAKMSKSKGNVVTPEEMTDKYGVDTVRLFMIFAAPPEHSLDWSDSGVEGAYRFLKRLWNFAYTKQALIKEINSKGATPEIKQAQLTEHEQVWRRELHAILQQANNDMQRLQFNTVVSASMKILNLLQEIANADTINAALLYEGFSILLRLLNPITPHIAQQIWWDLHFQGNLTDAPWPQVNTEALVTENITLMVQINGKLRAKITVAKDADQAMIEKIALENPHAQKFIGEAQVKKCIVVPGRLINIII